MKGIDGKELMEEMDERGRWGLRSLGFLRFEV